ncbi:hypothetical protein [Hymenobacter yonginensis]|uniref:DUF3137 domain-containing protein n=1 Tax=Hymenobacter yonginensis TaxID=748197 RepID=A0ABY7PN86_9BACT|nr:hypothetical protein [Hymenobacter yonginensis]WBO83648.1 hypothetical protein O9Z63_14840 [Hymenobacter yonginensis]
MQKKYYIVIGSLILLLLISWFEYLKTVYKVGIQSTLINVGFNVLMAILTGLIIGIYFDISSRKEIFNDMLRNFNISKEVINAGIVKYYSNFSDFDLRNSVANCSDVIIYLTYGQTVFNNIRDSLTSVAGKKNATITLFMFHEDNPFIDGLGNHWGANDQSYAAARIKQRVVDSQQTLFTYFSDMKARKKLKAKVKIYIMKRHPVFYSFYRMDDYILFCPSKISVDKSVKPIAIYVKDTLDKGSIYKKCMEEIKSIIDDPTSYELKQF